MLETPYRGAGAIGSESSANPTQPELSMTVPALDLDSSPDQSLAMPAVPMSDPAMLQLDLDGHDGFGGFSSLNELPSSLPAFFKGYCGSYSTSSPEHILSSLPRYPSVEPLLDSHHLGHDEGTLLDLDLRLDDMAYPFSFGVS